MTELEYVNNLIDKYYELFNNVDISIMAAMIDVTNTIEAIDWHNKELAYYNEVLNILKEKLMIFKCSNI